MILLGDLVRFLLQFYSFLNRKADGTRIYAYTASWEVWLKKLQNCSKSVDSDLIKREEREKALVRASGGHPESDHRAQ